MQDEDNFLNDIKLRELFKLDCYMKVYGEVLKYCAEQTASPNEQSELEDKLLISYLKIASKRNEGSNFLEKTLMSCGILSNEVLKFFLMQDLDMKCEGHDLYNVPCVLAENLASRITNPKIMLLFLEKIKNLDQFYFYNDVYKSHTDLCRMNIQANNFDKALEAFDNYSSLLYGIDDEEASRSLQHNENELYIEGFGGKKDDILFQILLIIKDNRSVLGAERQDFVKHIVYSDKIKMFNFDNLSLLKQILDNEEYIKFIDYLSTKENSGDITMFVCRNYDNAMLFETLSKENAKLKKKTV